MASFSDFTDFQLVLNNNMVENYNVKQYGNFYLMKEISTGVWVSPNDININPINNVEIQTLLDTYSGTPSKTTFTAQELVDMAASSTGNIVLIFAETLVSGIALADYETNLAQITNSTDKPIWSYEII